MLKLIALTLLFESVDATGRVLKYFLYAFLAVFSVPDYKRIKVSVRN